ncbi:MAG: hypothetical protein DSM106950_03160 [Stigonema ocellatum SAG 48.90 = DSM 106950]|nr:hypothetical protein [Stigonema ocellatum SAG 48.90 = DSM 106950]
MTEPGNRSEESQKIEGKTPHGEQRSQEAQAGDTARQVGDVNRVVREGRLLQDAETGYYVYLTLPCLKAMGFFKRFCHIS